MGIPLMRGIRWQKRPYTYHNITATYNDSILSGHGYVVSLEQLNDTLWSARQEHGVPIALRQVSHVQRVEPAGGGRGYQLASRERGVPVDILGHIDSFRHKFGIDTRGQRKLHQDTMHLGIVVVLLQQ